MCFITWHFAWQKILPPGYIHLLCHHELLEMSGDVENFRAALKLQLITEEQVQRWLEDFQKTSALTWRKSRTYPDSGRYNKYRVGTSSYVTEKCFKGNLISKLSLFTFFRHCYWMWFISVITFFNVNVIMVTGLIAKKVWKKKKKDFMFSCNIEHKVILPKLPKYCILCIPGGSEMSTQNVQFIIQDVQKYQLPCYHVSDSQEIYVWKKV